MRSPSEKPSQPAGSVQKARQRRSAGRFSTEHTRCHVCGRRGRSVAWCHYAAVDLATDVELTYEEAQDVLRHPVGTIRWLGRWLCTEHRQRGLAF